MKIIVDNLAVNYQDKGSGPVVLVLHGWGTNAANMHVLSDHLSQKYRVITPDMPGFGSSERPTEAWGMGEYASFVRSLLDKLEIKQPYAVIGHSFGGRTVLKSVGENIIQPEKVVLLGSAGVKHGNSVRNIAYKSAAKVGKAVFKIPGLSKFSDTAKTKLYSSAGSTDYLQANEMKDIFAKVIDEDLQGCAAQIKQPSLLIWGENDQEAPVEDANILHGLIKQSQLVVVPNVGHFVHTEAGERVLAEIDKFL